MMTREDIRELAAFQADSDGCALSFYFQPRTPQNKSHKEETILAKDLVRQALREAEKQGKNSCARADLDRILEIAGNLRGNQAKAKAVFASSTKKIWREFDLPPQLPGTQLFVNRRFHLKPLAVLLGAQPMLCVALVDRQRGRFFDLRLDELKERGELFRSLPRSRSDGYGGYNAGHVERRVANEYKQHYKQVADRLKEELERGVWEKLVVGCHDTNWSEFEAHLHPYVRQRLLGHFPADIASVTNDEIRENAGRMLREIHRPPPRKAAAGSAEPGQRQCPGRHRTAPRLALARTWRSADAVSGRQLHGPRGRMQNCGHMDSHMVPFCAGLRQSHTRTRRRLRGDDPASDPPRHRLFYVKNDPEFDKVGNIAALLRFRADQARTPVAASA